ncbi:unnamed protein product [Arctogadus glacialis]
MHVMNVSARTLTQTQSASDETARPGEQPTLKQQGNLEQPVKMKMDLANGHPNGPSDASDVPRLITTTTTIIIIITIIITIILSQYPPSVCSSVGLQVEERRATGSSVGLQVEERRATGSSVGLQVEERRATGSSVGL